MHKHILALALVTTSFAAIAQAKVDIQPGMWEYQMEVKMAGMQQNMPATTMRRCLTQQDVAQNKHLSGEQANNPCTLSNLRTAGNKTSFDINCKMEGMTMKGSSTVSATPTSMEIESQMQMVPPPAPGMGSMTQKMRAKRVGNC